MERAAKRIFSSYRRDQFAEPEGFIVQLGLLFGKYDIGTVEAATDPRNSSAIQLRYKFPPGLAEIKEALDDEADRRARIAASAKQPKPQFNRPYFPPESYPGCRANLFVHADTSQYPALQAWSQTSDADARDWKVGEGGIWIALSVWEDFCGGRLHAKQIGSGWHAPTDAELRAYYGQREAEAAREA